MSSISDAFDSLKATLYDRISSPFTATFLFVFSFYYWPIIFITIDASLNSTQKISAIGLLLSNEKLPGLCKLIAITITTILTISTLSILAFFIKEYTDGLNKKIRNKFNPDYVNSKKYTEAIAGLSENLSSLVESNSNKDRKIGLLNQIASLNDTEKELLKRAIRDGGISYDKLGEEKTKVCEQLHSKGFIGKSNNDYRCTDKELQAILEVSLK